MVEYPKIMERLRNKFIPQKIITVLLPPIKTDCTCLDDEMSIMNSPVDYCSACGNTGYIITEVSHDVSGVVVDYLSDSQFYPVRLEQAQGYNYDAQQYVIHANLSDCTVVAYDNQNCFDLSKEVKIEQVNYRILSINHSEFLGQIRVIISRTN